MKNRKGFTLIELLAVIVILAIITLIAVPVILNMIGKAKVKASEASALGYIDAVEHYVGLSQADVPGYDVKLPITSGSITCTKDVMAGWNEECAELFEAVDSKTKGKKPSSAVITIKSDGKVVSGSRVVIDRIRSLYDGKEIVKKGVVKEKSETNNTNYYSDYKCIASNILFGGENDSTTGRPSLVRTDFKCNVDGTGYNKSFMYVTDLEEDPAYAVLVATEPFISEKVYYGSDASPDALNLLPTVEDWQNVSLVNTERKVSFTNRFGQTTTTNLSYAGYAARMLSYDEIVRACGEGTPTEKNYLKTKCSYVFNNSFWIESSVDWMAVNMSDKKLIYSTDENYVYPVIEVLKIDMNF